MKGLVSIVIALGLLLALALPCLAQEETSDLVFEKYIKFNVTGTGSLGARIDYSAGFDGGSRYALELRSVDSTSTIRANFSIKEDKMMGSTKYTMAGWWNTLGEKVGDTLVTSEEYRAVASGISLSGREIVGSGLTKTMLDKSYISQYVKASGKGGEATVGMAFFDRYADEEGNVTMVSVQNRATFSGNWSITYSFADPIEEGAELELGWSSICNSITGWAMPPSNLNLEGE